MVEQNICNKTCRNMFPVRARSSNLGSVTQNVSTTFCCKCSVLPPIYVRKAQLIPKWILVLLKNAYVDSSAGRVDTKDFVLKTSGNSLDIYRYKCGTGIGGDETVTVETNEPRATARDGSDSAGCWKRRVLSSSC